MEAQSLLGLPSPATMVSGQTLRTAAGPGTQGQPHTLFQAETRLWAALGCNKWRRRLAWENVNNLREVPPLPACLPPGIPVALAFAKGLTRWLTASVRAETCAWLCSCPSSRVATQGPPVGVCSLQPPQLTAGGQHPACQAQGSLG